MTFPRCARPFALTGLVLFAVLGTAVADERDDKIAELTKRVTELEQRLAAIEKTVEPVAAQTNVEQVVKQQQNAARKRMSEDRRKYKPAQLADAEGLYQVANKNWRSPQAKESLKQMVEKYPDVNRTGCAVLYLGQMAKGDERRALLQNAIDKFSDCYYGDGAQVGPLARYLLALDYQEGGETEKAQQLFDELRQKYPQAITHRGELISAQLPK